MARIRTIKPELLTGRTASGWPDDVFRTFVGLLTHVDDKGRAEDDPDLIKGAIAPRLRKVTPARIEAHIDRLVADQTACRYVGDDGVPYFHLINFNRDQRINRPSQRHAPACPKHDTDAQAQLPLGD